MNIGILENSVCFLGLQPDTVGSQVLHTQGEQGPHHSCAWRPEEGTEELLPSSISPGSLPGTLEVGSHRDPCAPTFRIAMLQTQPEHPATEGWARRGFIDSGETVQPRVKSCPLQESGWN